MEFELETFEELGLALVEAFQRQTRNIRPGLGRVATKENMSKGYWQGKRSLRVIVEDLVGKHQAYDADTTFAGRQGSDRIVDLQPVDVEEGEEHDRRRHLRCEQGLVGASVDMAKRRTRRKDAFDKLDEFRFRNQLGLGQRRALMHHRGWIRRRRSPSSRRGGSLQCRGRGEPEVAQHLRGKLGDRADGRRADDRRRRRLPLCVEGVEGWRMPVRRRRERRGCAVTRLKKVLNFGRSGRWDTAGRRHGGPAGRPTSRPVGRTATADDWRKRHASCGGSRRIARERRPLRWQIGVLVRRSSGWMGHLQRRRRDVGDACVEAERPLAGCLRMTRHPGVVEARSAELVSGERDRLLPGQGGSTGRRRREHCRFLKSEDSVQVCVFEMLGSSSGRRGDRA